MKHFCTVLGLGAVLLSCEEDAERRTSAPAQRSQAVQGTATSTTTHTATAPVASAPQAAAKPRAPLCGGKLYSDAKPLPKKPIGRRSVSGAPELPAQPSFREGFTWVNFWAAWCVPCKEEIPRLLGWQSKLGPNKLRVLFVSLDDDERQLEKFLREQPAAGVRTTYWLREGKEREDWLMAAGVSPDPDLPVHLLVDSAGKVRCQVRGAVEDSDFDGLVALLGG